MAPPVVGPRYDGALMGPLVCRRPSTRWNHAPCTPAAHDPVFGHYAGGKYRMIPIFERAVQMASARTGLKVLVGSGVDGSTFPHGTQALEFVALVKHGGMNFYTGTAGWDHDEC